jgi:cytosine deaminase
LAELGVALTDLESPECVALMASFIAAQPEIWFEDIGGA